MSAKARAALRAEMIDFACYVDDEDLEGKAFVDAFNAFFAGESSFIPVI